MNPVVRSTHARGPRTRVLVLAWRIGCETTSEGCQLALPVHLTAPLCTRKEGPLSCRTLEFCCCAVHPPAFHVCVRASRVDHAPDSWYGLVYDRFNVRLFQVRCGPPFILRRRTHTLLLLLSSANAAMQQSVGHGLATHGASPSARSILQCFHPRSTLTVREHSSPKCYGVAMFHPLAACHTYMS